MTHTPNIPTPRVPVQPRSLIGGAFMRHYERERYEPRQRRYFTPSDAGRCARQISFKLLGARADEKPVPPSQWYTRGLGQAIEDVVTGQLEAEYGDKIACQVKISQRLTTKHGPLSVYGFADYCIDLPEGREVWDLKTTGNYGYGEKVAGSDYRGVVTAPEGPGDEHVLQTAIYGGLLGADAIGVSYISRDPLGGYKANTPYITDPELLVAADFRFPMEDVADAASDELDRQAGIMRRVEAGTIAKRIIPGCAEITGWDHKGLGVWTDHKGRKRTDWACRYCDFRERCETYDNGVQVFIRQETDAPERTK